MRVVKLAEWSCAFCDAKETVKSGLWPDGWRCWSVSEESANHFTPRVEFYMCKVCCAPYTYPESRPGLVRRLAAQFVKKRTGAK